MTNKQGEAVAQKTARYTPGPWVQGEDIDNPELITSPIKNDGAYYYVAQVWDQDDENEYQANARLITQAPNLLKAGMTLLATIRAEKTRGCWTQEEADLDAAIHKATGEE